MTEEDTLHARLSLMNSTLSAPKTNCNPRPKVQKAIKDFEMVQGTDIIY